MEGKVESLGIGDRVYTELDIIKLRKIRDTLGVVWQNPKLNDAEKAIIEQSVLELAFLPGVDIACCYKARGQVHDTSPEWGGYL